MSNRPNSSFSIRTRAEASSTKKTSRDSSNVPVAPPRESLQRLLTTEEVATLLSIAPATAVFWRSQKQGPTWVRLGRGRRAPIRYRLEAVEAYIAQMESAQL
ncbi:helix-turn-helix domain-containing protein [Microvirga pakistanensis]|uniref:helix-turn-helix transcriptional regulator n=1 Tax=Microvirga pakistanensis TaxID=1682650 RepID=UPI00106DCC3E